MLRNIRPTKIRPISIRLIRHLTNLNTFLLLLIQIVQILVLNYNIMTGMVQMIRVKLLLLIINFILNVSNFISIIKIPLSHTQLLLVTFFTSLSLRYELPPTWNHRLINLYLTQLIAIYMDIFSILPR